MSLLTKLQNYLQDKRGDTNVEENIGDKVLALELTSKKVEPTPIVAKQATMDKETIEINEKEEQKRR